MKLLHFTFRGKMKRTYHLCWSAEEEVLCRTREDYIRCIICLCIAAYESGSKLIAYCIMSNHVHLCIRSTEIDLFIKKFRYSYTRYYNSKYQRSGRLGERSFFRLELKGIYHTLAAIAYILRNPLHHGICKTPFEYEFSSVTGIFTKELGHLTSSNEMTDKIVQRKLPSHHKLPSGIKLSRAGIPLPETIIDVADLEHLFSTARTYLYYMNRISGEEWEREQEKDRLNISPIKLENIEAGVCGTSIREMLINENGRGREHVIQDISLCEAIDKFISEKFPDKTVYTLRPEERLKVGAKIGQHFHVSQEQLSRCLATSYATQQNRA